MADEEKKAAVPAWKLRQEMKSEQSKAPPPSKAALDVQAKLKKKMQQAALDPNLPAAFKVANVERLAFSRQQQRRKNNDTFNSMNSTHPRTSQKALIINMMMMIHQSISAHRLTIPLIKSSNLLWGGEGGGRLPFSFVSPHRMILMPLSLSPLPPPIIYV